MLIPYLYIVFDMYSHIKQLCDVIPFNYPQITEAVTGQGQKGMQGTVRVEPLV